MNRKTTRDREGGTGVENSRYYVGNGVLTFASIRPIDWGRAYARDSRGVRPRVCPANDRVPVADARGGGGGGLVHWECFRVSGSKTRIDPGFYYVVIISFYLYTLFFFLNRKPIVSDGARRRASPRFKIFNNYQLRISSTRHKSNGFRSAYVHARQKPYPPPSVTPAGKLGGYIVIAGPATKRSGGRARKGFSERFFHRPFRPNRIRVCN